MKRQIFVVLAAAILGAALWSGLRPSLSRDTPSAQAPGPGSAEELLHAEVYVVAPMAVRDTVRTVGTLAANESVNVVAEISRRLVAVQVTEGSVVESGALLFKLDDADLQAQLAELDVRRRMAARTQGRQHALQAYDKRALSQQAYDQAESELRVIEAQMTTLKVTLAKTEIRAPFRGRAGLRRVSEGAWITPDTLLTTLHDTSRVKLDFAVPERYAGGVFIGQTVTFEVAGRPGRFDAVVMAIEPTIDAPTRSLQVRAISDNPNGLLLPGAFAAVEVPIEQRLDGIVVPAQAIIPSATGHTVYVLRDGRAMLQEVEIGVRTREAVEIRSGLTAGDQVLTSNLLRVRPGARVEATTVGQGTS